MGWVPMPTPTTPWQWLPATCAPCCPPSLPTHPHPPTLPRPAPAGAAGAISNHLLFMLASGEVFGKDQPIALSLVGSDRSREALEGVAMELEDSLYPLLSEVKMGVDPYRLFEGADWALLIGAKPRGPGMQRRDLLDINGQLFQVGVWGGGVGGAACWACSASGTVAAAAAAAAVTEP